MRAISDGEQAFTAIGLLGLIVSWLPEISDVLLSTKYRSRNSKFQSIKPSDWRRNFDPRNHPVGVGLWRLVDHEMKW